MPRSQADLRVIDRVVELLRTARRLLFITGAGLSADSGLPTYHPFLGHPADHGPAGIVCRRDDRHE
jgi:hypothetical protein